MIKIGSWIILCTSCQIPRWWMLINCFTVKRLTVNPTTNCILCLVPLSRCLLDLGSCSNALTSKEKDDSAVLLWTFRHTFSKLFWKILVFLFVRYFAYPPLAFVFNEVRFSFMKSKDIFRNNQYSGSHVTSQVIVVCYDSSPRWSVLIPELPSHCRCFHCMFH